MIELSLGNFKFSLDTVESNMLLLKEIMECDNDFGVDLKFEDAMQILAGEEGSARDQNFVKFYTL